MTTETEKHYCLDFDLISVFCCVCYEDYWKNLRKSRESKEFDYSIEKKIHFANFFMKKKLYFIVVLIVLKKSF